VDNRKHWENIYQEKGASSVTWFQDKPRVSLGLISDLLLEKTVPIIDVGGGASTLVDHLIEDGFKNTTVLDLSENALAQSQKRLGKEHQNVEWIIGDITSVKLPRKFTLWHDRAVFHFLTNKKDQELYIHNLVQSLYDVGFFIISTFAEDGPLKCSGLEICRYSKDELCDLFANNFELINFKKETHVSPKAMEQKFNYWVFKKKLS